MTNEPISIQSLPPSVIRTVPQAGEVGVDPSLTEIKVTFSKDMITEEMWSWCTHTEDSFPEIDKDGIHYLEDDRTCVLPVNLEAGKTYALWINSQHHQSFKDLEQNSAVPYLLVFETGEPIAENIKEAEAEALAVAEKWLELVDGEQYAESWQASSQFFQMAVSEAQWDQAIQVARKPLGDNFSRELVSNDYMTSIPGAPDGEYVVIQFRSSFENKSLAVETITPMKDQDGEWRVSGYFIK